jgi:hypothetical protein
LALKAVITLKSIKSYALSLPETDEHPHFDLISCRVNKKIFITINMPMKRCTLKFTREFQDIFTSISKGKIYPVPNAWGRSGWTTVELQDINPELLNDAILIAWRGVAPKAFQKKYPELYRDEG